MNKLKELEKKLDKVKKSKIKDIKYNQKPTVNYSIAINISIELTTGIGLGVSNTGDSISEFARSCMSYSLGLGYPLYLSTINTLHISYDGTYRDIFQTLFEH